MSKEFPYIREKGRYLPMIPVLVGGVFQTYALIDSGAEISIFRPEVGEVLGLDIEKGDKTELTGIGGRIAVYRHYIPLTVADWQIKCLIAFSYEFKVSVNILGRNNFFHKFVVCFDEIKRVTALCPQKG